MADSQKSEMLKNNLQGNDDLSCSPSRCNKSLTCLRVPWLLKSLSSDQPAQATVIYVSHSVALMQFQEIKKNRMGAQWLNIRVFDPRPIQAVASSSITGVTVLCPLARHINPCLVVQPRTTRPDITEKMFSWT